MKKISTFLFLSSLAFSQLNCTQNAANENSNQANIGVSVSPTTAAQTDQSNASVKPADTPVPTFTNADEALTEGKKLLDALETEKAIDALTQATKLNSDLAEAHFNLGIAYALVEKDEEEKAVTQVETAPTPKPSRRQPKKNAPVVRTKNSEKAFENAVKAYKKFLVKNPKDDVAHFNLARAYNKLNEDEDALKAVKEAVKLKPDDYEYQTELGVILIKLAQYEEAVAALKKALKIDPTNLQVEDLLEKAEAGRRRVDFGNKPKPQPQQPQESSRPRGNPKPKETAAPKEESKPAPPNANQ
jgi:tetratricopeptide (TPR) repeat protein